MNLKKMIEELQEKGKLELKDGSIIIKLSQDEFIFYNSIQQKNTGNYNSGFWNSGNGNSSNFNSGNMNSGDSNSGNRNSGESNSGDYNSGCYNTGNCNYGDYNTGKHNINNYNTGNYNIGCYNTGDYNYGDYNTGDFNTGDFNTGDFNSGNYNYGCFNTKTPKLKFFDEETDMTMEEWWDSEAFAILRKIDLNPIEWIWKEDMTDDEKEEHPEYKTTGGYLKEIDTDKAFLSWWNGLTEKEREVIKNIPNFNADKFYKITGIKV